MSISNRNSNEEGTKNMTRNKKLVKMMALAVAASTVATSVPAYAAFDATYYAQQNPDVVAAIGTKPADLEMHYNLFGKKEGRAGSADEVGGSALRQLFDAEYYAKLNPDVVAVYGNDANALFNHFLQFGIKEGRKVNPYFDVNAYKKAYPDLVAAFVDDIAAYYNHFATNGIKEHRTLGGFPAEKIVPGGVAVAVASSDSESSSGGGGGSSKPTPKPADTTPAEQVTPTPDPTPAPDPAPEVDENIPTLEDITIGKAETGRAIRALNLPTGVNVDDSTWKSSNEAIVTVGAGGALIALKEGTAIVSVKLDNEAATEISCTVTVVDAYVELDAEKLNVAVGTTERLTYSGFPSPGTCAFFSSDENIAKVDSEGLITGVGAGTAVITARYTVNNKDYTDTCQVTVSAPYVKLKKSELTVNDTTVTVDLAEELAPETVPSNKSVTYEIDDTDVADFDNTATVASTSSTGILTINKAGTATVTVKFAIGAKVYKSECALTVTQSPKGVALAKSEYTIYTTGGTLNIPRTVTGGTENPANRTVTSTRKDVATADISGNNIVVTPVNAGQTTIITTATIGDKEYEARCTVNVKVPSVVSVSGPGEVVVGKTIKLKAIADPTTSTITWTKNGDLVNIGDNPDGTVNVTGVMPGDAVITATVTGGGSKDYTVRVVDDATGSGEAAAEEAAAKIEADKGKLLPSALAATVPNRAGSDAVVSAIQSNVDSITDKNYSWTESL